MSEHRTKSGGDRRPPAATSAPAPPTPPPPRAASDAARREIVRAWRRLTTPPTDRRAGPGAGTLVACSGGADSAALAIALAGARTSNGSPTIILGHVVHDLRPENQALADRDAVRELAAQLACGFLERRVACRGEHGRQRNLEAAARRLRYAALAEMAAEASLPFVATAHQATDQLETVLMGLMRGAGPRGLAGVRPRRAMCAGAAGGRPGSRNEGPTVQLIRPMLGVTREDAEAICREGNWAWREDATNADTTRLRSALRHRVLPILREIRPNVEHRAAAAAGLLRENAALITQLAELLIEQSATHTRSGIVFNRTLLRTAPAIVAGEALRLAAQQLTEHTGADRLSQRMVRDALRAVRDASGEPRSFQWGRMSVRVGKADVTLARE